MHAAAGTTLTNITYYMITTTARFTTEKLQVQLKSRCQKASQRRISYFGDQILTHCAKLRFKIKKE